MRRAALVLLLLSACEGSTPVPRDVWLTAGNPQGAELSESLGTWRALDPTLAVEVIEPRRQEAAGLLAKEACVAIGRERGMAFAGGVIPDIEGKKVCLIRGLAGPTGKFTVYVQRDQVYVHHGGIGSTPPDLRRRALVVLLEVMPGEVLVGAGAKR